MQCILTSLWRDVSIVDKGKETSDVLEDVIPVDGVNVTQAWITANEHVTNYDLCNTHTASLLPAAAAAAATVHSFNTHIRTTNALFSCVCTHHMELNSPQRSFLRISHNVSETSQNTLFSICIFCRPLATHYPAPQIQLLDFGAL